MSIHTVLIIALIAFLSIIGFIKWMNRPVRQRITNLNELERFLKNLIGEFTDGSVLIVEDRKTKRFIQFAKKARFILHFGFPDAPWSRKYFKRVEDAFKKKNIQFTINPTGEKIVTKFLDIEIIKIDKGVELAKTAFSAMDIPASGHFQAYYKGELTENALRGIKRNGKDK